LQRLRNRLVRHRPPLTNLDEKLLADRDSVRHVVGPKRRQAIALTIGG